MSAKNVNWVTSVQNEFNGVRDEMSIEQLNEYLIDRANELFDKSRKRRAEYDKTLPAHTTDIVPPFCSINWTLLENIENVMNCYNNTLMAGLFYETEVFRLGTKLETLHGTMNKEQCLPFDFLESVGMTEQYYEYAIEKKTGFPYMKKNDIIM